MENRLSVILSTFDQPDLLQKALWGYACQSDKSFELVIADDGSGPETRETLQRVQQQTGLALQHVWHPHDGFRKCTILNKAILEARGDYLVFSDGDCIPRRDFIAVHRAHARPGGFLSGSVTRLSMELSRAIECDDIETGRAFDRDWLRAHGLRTRWYDKHGATPRWAQFLNLVSTAGRNWNGCNASGWKKDLLAVNGFNEAMGYGGLDRELGERLVNLGGRGRQVRNLAIILHLEHARDYATAESLEKNRLIRLATARQRLTWTPNGVVRSSA